MTLIPISEELVEDSTFTPNLGWWTSWLLGRRWTMEAFGERWCDSEDELLLLENTRFIPWDQPILDDEEDEW